MELIKLVDLKETADGKIIRVERDARRIVGRLYGIDIPAYPFTIATFGKEVEQLQEKNDGVLNSEYLLDVETDVAETIDKTREMFTQVVAKKYPELKAEHKKTMVDELMGVFASGVFGGGDGVLSKNTQANLCSYHAFMYMYVLRCVNSMKQGHATIKTMMLDELIFPTCQCFTYSADGKLFIIDMVNADCYNADEAGIIDMTDAIFKLMTDYNVIPKDTRSLREWVDTYPKAWGGTEKALRVLGDNIARILFGYTENDCIQVKRIKTARQHMDDVARVALEKEKAGCTQQEHILVMAQAVADDVLRRHALAQVKAQISADADF